MVTLSDPNKTPRDIATARLATFRSELIGGRLRWLFSFFAAVSMITLGWTLSDPKLEIWFPVHAAGVTLKWLVAVGATAWVVLAALNWRNWLRAKGAGG